MSHNAEKLIELIGDIVVSSNNINRQFKTIDSAEDFSQDSLVFISDKAHLFDSKQSQPAVVITNTEVASLINDDGLCVIEVSDVRLAQAIVKQQYADYQSADTEWPQVHPSAVIHESARLAKSVRVGPNAVIGANVEIAENTVIRANAVIEHDAKIGNNCVIHNLVNIGYNCILGDRVIVRPGAIIGNEGFGFAQDDQKQYQRIPHTGIVEIGDDVQIGSNCNIDRGTYGKTVIARGVKIDGLCHIAHNVTIDEDALITAQAAIAGSSHIGKRVIASGQTGIIDHRTIADDAVLVHRCGVTEDIPSAGVWAGTPPKPFKEYVKSLNTEKILLKKIEKLKNEIDSLKK